MKVPSCLGSPSFRIKRLASHQEGHTSRLEGTEGRPSLLQTSDPCPSKEPCPGVPLELGPTRRESGGVLDPYVCPDPYSM